jgi:hypothetical protein
MKDYTMQLFFEGLSQLTGIVFDPVDTNIDFSLQLLCIRQIERYDIGVVIVRKEFFVNVQQVFIRAKDKSKMTELAATRP